MYERNYLDMCKKLGGVQQREQKTLQVKKTKTPNKLPQAWCEQATTKSQQNRIFQINDNNNEIETDLNNSSVKPSKVLSNEAPKDRPVASEYDGETVHADSSTKAVEKLIISCDVSQSDRANVHPAIVNRDVGFINFVTSGRADVDEILRNKMVSLGSGYFQNVNKELASVKYGIKRGLTVNWFVKSLQNGEEVVRTWFIYSPFKKAAYCFCCLLFSDCPDNLKSAFESRKGFTKWQQNDELHVHESSLFHREAFMKWKELEQIMKQRDQIDEVLAKQIENEREIFKAELKRVLDAIKFLTSQNLALSGMDENLVTSDYPGNFLSLLKLLLTYDSVIVNQLEKEATNPRSISHDDQKEFINILAKKVRDLILTEIRSAKYFGILFDTIPDISHKDRTSEVIRYVKIDYDKGDVEVHETFVDFIKIEKIDATSLENAILEKLEKDGLEFKNCRAQSYDYKAVMSGHLTSVQARLLNKNAKAIFINCNNHSLNLAGVHAAKVDPSIMTFFGTIEQIYVFFSSSTSRWAKMEAKLNRSVKKESETRWSAQKEAVSIMAVSFSDLVALVQDMNEDDEETADSREKTSLILNSLVDFSFVCYLQFWNKLLHSINITQKRLQSSNINISEAADELEILVANFTQEKENICHQSMEGGKILAKKWNMSTERRIRCRKQKAGEPAKDASLTLEQDIERVMKQAIDEIIEEIRNRSMQLQNLDQKFGFLLRVTALLFDDFEEKTLLRKCDEFAKEYEDDIESGMALKQDIDDCRMFFCSRRKKNPDSIVPATPQMLLKEIIKYGKDTFPNLRTGIQILLTIPVSIAGYERSFNKLKWIKSFFRSSLTLDVLSSLAILSIEKHKLNITNFDDVITDFANKKVR